MGLDCLGSPTTVATVPHLAIKSIRSLIWNGTSVSLIPSCCLSLYYCAIALSTPNQNDFDSLTEDQKQLLFEYHYRNFIVSEWDLIRRFTFAMSDTSQQSLLRKDWLASGSCEILITWYSISSWSSLPNLILWLASGDSIFVSLV